MLAHVTMDEGFRIMQAASAETTDVTIGMPVHVGYEDVTPDWTLFVFGPA